jgi:ketosteroid isomerase-like protein
MLVIATGALGAAAGAPATSASDVVHQFHAALTRGDAAAALALLATDAVILEAGALESREEYRRQHLAEDMRFAAAVATKVGPVRAVVAGDSAWVTSTSETTGTFDGQPIRSTGAELVVLTRSAEGWRIRAIHWSSRRRTTP